MSSLFVRVTSRKLDRLTKALERAGALFTISELKQIGAAGVKDARNAITEGGTPDRKPWRLTRDGRRAYGNSASMKRAIRYVVWSRNIVSIESSDIRSVVANKGRTSGTLVNYPRPVIVPLSRSIERRKDRAGGWGNIRAFKIRTKSGSVFLAERREGSRRLTLLGIFKKTLKHYRRQHFGEGRELRAVAKNLGASIAMEFER